MTTMTITAVIGITFAYNTVSNQIGVQVDPIDLILFHINAGIRHVTRIPNSFASFCSGHDTF